MNEKNKSTKKILEESERLAIAVRIINTHTYWTPLIIFKIGNPSEREIKLESHDYTLPHIEYKDREYYKKLVLKEFNQKMREKYDPDINQISPILWNQLCLTREKAKKEMEDMKRAASIKHPKKDYKLSVEIRVNYQPR